MKTCQNAVQTKISLQIKMESTILVLGNIMMDMVVPVDDPYLEKYKLQANSIQTAREDHLPIFQEISQRNDVTFSPGGSALNTVRMAQKLLGVQSAISLVCSVGNDPTGISLVDIVEGEGIKLLIQKVQGVSTGRCASLLTNGGKARTMVTDLGASLRFSHSSWLATMKDPAVWEMLAKTRILYITGYFLKVSPETALEITKTLRKDEVTVILNLNATWVAKSCKQDIVDLIPFVDIIFGNDTEFISFSRELGILSQEEGEEDIVRTLKHLWTFCLQTKRPDPMPDIKASPIIIVTRGESPVIVIEKGNVREYPVPVIPPESIVDSTGAGDAFVGGFLASFLKKHSIDECIDCGIWAAGEELKGFGFVLPSQVPNMFLG